MAEKCGLHQRVEDARRYSVEQFLQVQHILDGEDRVNGDERTRLLFERTYLQGLLDMAVHLGEGDKSITDLAKVVAQERLGYLTGKTETGILHVRPVGFGGLNEKDQPDKEKNE